MKRWIWRVLLVAAAMAALTVGASAKKYTSLEVAESPTPSEATDEKPSLLEINGVVYQLTKGTEGTANEGTVVGYTENLPSQVFILGEINVPKDTEPGTDVYTITSIQGTNTTGIIEGAFQKCPVSLTRVVIPASIVTVGDNAFEGCLGVDEVFFLGNERNNKTTTIGNSAFSGCDVKNLILPNGLQKIGASAFATNMLEVVIIPPSITEIGSRAFSPCPKLEAVYLPDVDDVGGEGKTPVSIPLVDGTVFAGAPFWTSSRVIHFGGTDRSRYKGVLFPASAIPSTGSNIWNAQDNLHPLTLYAQSTVTPSCSQGGLVQHEASCITPDEDHLCSLLGSGNTKNRVDFTQPLPHAYPEPKVAELQALLGDSYKPCEGWSGEIMLMCAMCGKSELVTKTAPKTEHTWKEDGKTVQYQEDIVTDATCGAPGTANLFRECSVCGTTQIVGTKTLPKLDHTYTSTSEWKVAIPLKNAGCDSDDPWTYDLMLPACDLCHQIPEFVECDTCSDLRKYFDDPTAYHPVYGQDSSREAIFWINEYIDHIYNEITGTTGETAHESLRSDKNLAPFIKGNETTGNLKGELLRATPAGHDFVMPGSPQEVYAGNCGKHGLTVTRRQCSKCGIIEGIWVKIDNSGKVTYLPEDPDNPRPRKVEGYECEKCEELFDDFMKKKAILDGLLDDDTGTVSSSALEAAYKDYNEAIKAYWGHLDPSDRANEAFHRDDLSLAGEYLPVKAAFTEAKPDDPNTQHTPPADKSEISYEFVDKDGNVLVDKDGNIRVADFDCTDKDNVRRVRIYKCAVCGKDPVKEPDPDFNWEHTGSNPREEIEYEEGNCENGGRKRLYYDACDICGKPFVEEKDAPALKHDFGDVDVTPRPVPATCTTPPMLVYDTPIECHNEGCTFHAGPGEPVVTGDPLGHLWLDPVPDPADQDMTPYDDCREKEIPGIAICDRDNSHTKDATITIPGKMAHNWSEWVVTTPATPEEDGVETRTCLNPNCGKQETRIIPAGTTTPPATEDPGTEDPGTTEPEPSEPSTPSSYTVTVITPSNGTVTASLSYASPGTSITITITPASDYELDILRVTTDTAVVTTSNLGGGRYSFTMPSANVEIRATFSRIVSSVNANWTGSASSSQSTAQTVVQSVPTVDAWGQIFRDIPTTHWAAGEINWANQMGYMNGTNGTFNPDGFITHQQMWMVMARLTGSNPTNMADARRWAVNGGFADGSAPEGSVNRHQLVTALYRCAHLMGTSNRSSTTLAGFPDSRTVPIGAREPFAWAIANGIIGGDANGKLNPNGTLSRAQFAVILYRFSQRV